MHIRKKNPPHPKGEVWQVIYDMKVPLVHVVNHPRSKLRYLGAIVVFGMLFLVGSVWFVANYAHSPSVPAPEIDVGRARRPPPAVSKPENQANRPNAQVRVFPTQPRIPGAGAGAAVNQPSMEVCLVESVTNLPLTAGRVAIRKGPSGPILADYELGGQSCVLFPIDAGSYLLRAESDGYLGVEQSVTVNLSSRRVRRVFSLQRHVLVRGIVRNAANRPQPGAYISLFQETYHVTVKSDAAGHFEAELFSPEIQKVYALRPPHRIVTLGPVVIREARNPNLEITLAEDSEVVKISGTVFDDLGRPVREAEVSVIPYSPWHVADKQHDAILQGFQQVPAKSDAEGHFLLEALPQNETILTVAGAKGCEVVSESISLKEDVVKDIHLKCHPTFGVIVEKEDGSVVTDAFIAAESPDGETAITPTPEKGRYFARAYPFRILAWTRWPGQDGYGLTRSEWIKNYRDPVRLVLGHARVDGVVRDASGAPISNFSVRVITADSGVFNVSFPFRSEDGSFSLQYLPPGKVTLEVMTEVAGPDGTRTSASFSQDVFLVEGKPAFLPAVFK